MGHRLIPSSSVIPKNDSTLLFTNAGMNQFKDIFAEKKKPDYPRAVSCQKCIRASGKHNDLNLVGFTPRHHTFFEMLGNFSFGDYFKEKAIYLAWEWLTKELKISPNNLYVTVYNADNYTFDLWKKIASELKDDHILYFGEKYNYWSMGKTGPNGVCTEIHYDLGKQFGNSKSDVVNGNTNRFIEIWNLVFPLFNQQSNGKITRLSKPYVDTGAGLERLASIMQNVNSNYDIDIFRNLIKAISDLANRKYEDDQFAHQVIADHLRALTFAIADGSEISNKGRNYVLRRILRRASYYGSLLEIEEPFIYKLVPVLVDEMGDVYPEIKKRQEHIMRTIKNEEEIFSNTLHRGVRKTEKIIQKTNGKIIDGKDVFILYDTYGFPYDLTEAIAKQNEMSLDKNGFEKFMNEQKKRSQTSRKN